MSNILKKKLKERLIIKNFGPIKSVDLELGKMNILIGESASGKSTVAKVLSICRYFTYIIDDGYRGKGNSNVDFWVSNYVDNALKDWGLYSCLNKESYWYYENNNYKVEFLYNNDLNDDKGNNVCFKLEPKSPIFIELVEEYKKIKEKRRELLKENDQLVLNDYFLLNSVKPIMNNPFYFPTERGLQSIFSIGRSSLENTSDSLYSSLSHLSKIAQLFSDETMIEPLSILYKNSNGHGYIKNQEQSEFSSLANGASGYQSTIPVVLTIKYYTEKERRKRTFIIEEPELNLYPKAQKKLVEFLTFSINDFDHQMLLTTHSPYILTALENLMYAFKMGNIADGKYKEQVKEIVEEKYWINPEDVNVYFLGKDGSVDLMQRDYALINKDYIDSVSDSINEQFDKLLSIDVAHQNESEE